MSATFTVTGSTGPGVELTAQVFNDVVRYEVDPDGQKLTLFFGDNSFTVIDISGATTFTTTISGTTYTVTVS